MQVGSCTGALKDSVYIITYYFPEVYSRLILFYVVVCFIIGEYKTICIGKVYNLCIYRILYVKSYVSHTIT